MKIIKTVLIVLSILLIFIVFILFGVLIKFKYKEDIILKDNQIVEYREKVTVNDYVEFINGKILNKEFIDTTRIGNKIVRVEYENQYGFINTKNFTLKVVDKTAPTIVVSDPYVVIKDKVKSLEDVIFCADDYDDNIDCKIEGEYSLNEVGSYKLKISAVDNSGNLAKKSFTLKVIEEDKNSKVKSSENTYQEFSDIYNKYKNANTMIGLDISRWQEDVDFKKIKEQGVEFVMLKLGGQNKINGSIIMDPKFLSNIEQALKENLEVGVYFYSYAASADDAKKQAEWVIDNLKGYDITFPVAFDWENWSNFSSFHIGFRTLNEIASTFIKEISSSYDAVLYSSKYYLENIWYKEEYNNWIAYYTSNFSNNSNYTMWQVCNNGKIEGINSYVDIDVFYKQKNN